MIHPEVFSQNTNESVTTAAGRYDFTRLSHQEYDIIKSVLTVADSAKYPKKLRGLGLANEAYCITYKPRYILHEIIVQRYATSKNPYDLLAVAAAYKTKGAFGRDRAIEYYEAYLKSANLFQKRTAAIYFPDAAEPFFSYQLSELYEMAYRLPEALSYARRAYAKRLTGAAGYPLRVGSVLQKTDIIECVTFYQRLINSPEYGNCAKVKSAYDEAVKKEKAGYQYKPRRSKLREQDIQIEADIAKMATQFIAI